MNENRIRVGFVGLGSMGLPMAVNVVRAGLAVSGFDIDARAVERLADAGGKTADSPAAAAEGAEVAVVVVLNSDQVERVLFDEGGVLETLPSGATVMVCTTVAPDYMRSLGDRLEARGYGLLDCPISGGIVGAEGGSLTTMASGPPAAFRACEPVIAAVGGKGKSYRLGAEVGIGSTVKMVNQLLAGIHIAASAEAVALGARAGADPRVIYEVISNAAGSSWMFNDRVPHMLAGDYTPHSALDIFVKDLGIVLDFGESTRFPLPLTAAAHQMFLMGAAAGLGRQDDSSVVKIFEQIAGVSVSSPARPGR